MNFAANLLGFVLLTALAAVVAFWPEALGYAIYTSVSPQTEFGRIALTLGLIFVGGGISIFMAVLGGILWMSGVAALGSSRRW